MFKEAWYGSVRLLNVSFNKFDVPMDWRGECIVPQYKGKGNKYECRTQEVLVC